MIAAFQCDIAVQRDRKVVDVTIISAGGMYTAARISPDRADAIASLLQDAARAARQPQPEPQVTP